MYELIFTNLASGVKIQEWWFAADAEKRLLFLGENDNYHIDKVIYHNPPVYSKEFFKMIWKCFIRENKYSYIPKIGA